MKRHCTLYPASRVGDVTCVGGKGKTFEKSQGAGKHVEKSEPERLVGCKTCRVGVSSGTNSISMG